MLFDVFETQRYYIENINKSADIWSQLYQEVEVFFELNWIISLKNMEVTHCC